MSTAFICEAIRTPFGRYGGVLASVRADNLAAAPLRALLERLPTLDPAAVDDVVYGCANQAGEDNRNVARMALLLAGLPESVAGTTVNRLCGSSLEAVIAGARAIATGDMSIVMAGGVESMSRAPFVLPKSDVPFSRGLVLEDTTLGWRFINPELRRLYGVDSMAETAENVADAHHISREDQDRFAWQSQRRAMDGAIHHAEEIIPVHVAGREGAVRLVERDEHPRPDTTVEKLSRLEPIVRPSGTVTAGNASGINDGASALLLASEDAIVRHGLTPVARVVASAVAGVAPRLMGMGPVPATRKALERAGIREADLDVIELNEAFAAQAVAALRELGIADDDPRVNPNGGAIAIGHPLGASGGRLIGTAVRQLRRSGGRYALATMCIGVGQGIALIVERV
jgi:3-oxoadipyl-CoA thiolase